MGFTISIFVFCVYHIFKTHKILNPICIIGALVGVYRKYCFGSTAYDLFVSSYLASVCGQLQNL